MGQQHCVFFLRTKYIQLSPHISREVWEGGQDVDGQCDTYVEGPG
jgi:hypothetical protein